MPKILLLGTGYTLERVASKLSPKSFIVTSRQDLKLAEFRKKDWISEKVDVLNESEILDIFSKYPEIEYVVDSIPPSRDSDPSRFQVAVISALSKLKNLKKLIYLSTTGVFGVTDGSWVNEETNCNPDTPNGKARLDVEELYFNSGIPVTVLRLPAIYGPERGLEISLAKGSYRLIDNGEKYTNRIHVEDLSQVIIECIKAKNLPKILCVSDDTPTKALEAVGFLCSKLNLEYPKSMSYEEAKKAGLYTMLGNQRVSNKLMKEILKLELKFPSYKSAF